MCIYYLYIYIIVYSIYNTSHVYILHILTGSQCLWGSNLPAVSDGIRSSNHIGNQWDRFSTEPYGGPQNEWFIRENSY